MYTEGRTCVCAKGPREFKVTSKPDRTLQIRSLFERYWQWTRDFWGVVERRAILLSPHHERAIQVAARVQCLFIERERYRFDYLFARPVVANLGWNSFSSVCARVEKQWLEIEEEDLCRLNPEYAALIARLESAKAQAQSDRTKFTLFEDFQDDKVYCEARGALADNLAILEKEFKTLEPER